MRYLLPLLTRHLPWLHWSWLPIRGFIVKREWSSSSLELSFLSVFSLWALSEYHIRIDLFLQLGRSSGLTLMQRSNILLIKVVLELIRILMVILVKELPFAVDLFGRRSLAICRTIVIDNNMHSRFNIQIRLLLRH